MESTGNVKDWALPRKVVIRRLPPTLSEDEFLEQIGSLPANDYFKYCSDKDSFGMHSCSRAYIRFLSNEDIFRFRDTFDNYIFLDSRGNEFPAVVEFATFQKVPKAFSKEDKRCNTIDEDADYTKFVEHLNETEEKTTTSIETTLEELERQAAESASNQSTPLLDYLRQRKLDREKAREDRKRRDEDARKRREIERRRQAEIDRKRREEAKKRQEAEALRRRQREEAERKAVAAERERKKKEKEKRAQEEKQRRQDAAINKAVTKKDRDLHFVDPDEIAEDVEKMHGPKGRGRGGSSRHYQAQSQQSTPPRFDQKRQPPSSSGLPPSRFASSNAESSRYKDGPSRSQQHYQSPQEKTTVLPPRFQRSQPSPSAQYRSEEPPKEREPSYSHQRSRGRGYRGGGYRGRGTGRRQYYGDDDYYY